MKKIIGFMLVFIMVFPFFLETFTYAYENNKIENIEKINNSNTENIWEEKTTNNQENKNNILENNKTNNNENKIDKDEKENNENKNSEEIDTLQSFEETNNNEQENLKTPVVNQSNKTIEDGTYYIRTAINRNKVFDIEGMSKANQARLQLWERSSQLTDNQKFEITYLSDGYYKIEAKHSGKSLDVMGAGKANCTKVQQYESNGTDAQQWIIKDAGDGYYNIISKCNDLYLDIPSASAVNGAKIQMYEGNGSTAQKFKLEKIEKIVGKQTVEDGEYYIESAINKNKVFDIESMSKANQARLQLWEKSSQSTDNQKFKITYISDGYYKIEAKHSGKSLDVMGAGKANCTKVQQYESNGTDAQQWIIKDAGDGYYNIISKCNDLYLDIPSASAVNGAKIQMYEGNGSTAQKFKLEKIEELVGKQTIEDGEYKIKSASNTNMVIDIDGLSRTNGASAQIWEESELVRKNQRFNISWLGNGYYKIEVRHSGKVLDVVSASKLNGTKIQQYESNGTDAQQWIIKDAGNGCYNIISKCNGLYLDITNSKAVNGAKMQVYEKNSSDTQKFIFEKVDKEKCNKTLENGVYKISTGLNSNMVLDIAEGSQQNCANLQIWGKGTTQQQKFQVTYNTDGYYEIKAVHSGKVLDIAGASSNNGANVQQYESNGTDAQKWILRDAGNGYYYIISRGAEAYLDVVSGRSSNGTNVDIYDGNGTAAQKFKFESAPIIDNDEYNIKTALDNNKTLDVDVGTSNVQIWTLNSSSTNQAFKVENLNNGYYKITCDSTNKVLTNVNNNVVQSDYTGSDNQQWKIEVAGNNYYYIKLKGTNLYLDIQGAHSTDGTNVQMYEGNESIAQKFKFEKWTAVNRSDFSNIDTSKYKGYKEALQKLQQQHPNWTIKLVYTGLKWEDVLNAEQGRDSKGEPYSLTQATGSWRDSSDNNSYQGGWYKASREAIAYMMDPRNSLDQYYVFQFQNLARSSNETVQKVSTMTNGTYLQNYSSTLVSASQSYNVSAFHLASRMLMEQGTSGWSINGYAYNGRTVYNYANIGATGSTLESIKSSGAAYAYKNHWFTPKTCINGTAQWIYNNYLSNGQNTKYFEKYNVVKQPFYTHQYMQNIRAANDEGYNTAKSLEKNGLLNSSYEFLIPVYEGMPDTACARP